ncbi:unnamed protein product [Parajaminaea phylloscopi]
MSAAAAKKSSAKKSATPSFSYLEMVKEAIAAHPADARNGISRPTIKKFIQAKHPDTGKVPEASFNKFISKAIARGAETKALVLPKGASGKVKLAPKADKAAPKKPKAPAAPKAEAAPKKAAATGTSTKAKAKPAAAKKSASTTAAKKTASSTATKAKKPAAKKAAPAAKKATATKPKKAAAAKK